MREQIYSEMTVQPDNPSDVQRHQLAKAALAQKGRSDDYCFIIRDMSPPQDITSIASPGKYKNIKVGIIGGGLAGMSAAFELRKLGFDITIFEALEDRIGGRVYTHYFDPEKRLYGEFGAMRMPVTHETLWHYINLFKLDTRPFIQTNENAFIYIKNTRVRNDPEGMNVMRYIYPKFCLEPWERCTPWQELVYRGFEKPLLEALPEERREILQVKCIYNAFVRLWDAVSNRNMLEAMELSQGAIDILKNFVPLAGQNLYNSYIDYVQELYSVDLSYLYEIPGGMVKLPLAFYNSFKSKTYDSVYSGIAENALGRVSWRNGTAVEGIYPDEGGMGVVLALNNVREPGRRYEHFDYVISAVPFSTLRTIDIKPRFSNLKMQAIREVNYINAQKTMLVCSRRFWEEGTPDTQIIGGASITDLPISQIYYPSDHGEYCRKKYSNIYMHDVSTNLKLKGEKSCGLPGEPAVLLASYNFSLEATRLANMNDSMRLKEVMSNVEMVHGLPMGYLKSIVTNFKTVNWDDEIWFRGALCYYTPEQKRLFSYGAAAPEYGNRVFFAGEHISAKHRWMQGALKSGMEAANALARECSIQYAE